MRAYRLISSLLFLFLFSHSYYSQTVCAEAQPVCTGTGNIFPGQTTGAAQAGPTYSCLNNQPNPSWHTLQIATSGSITINMFGTAVSPVSNDIDFICYGPFSSTVGACGALSNPALVVGCSYSGSGSENLTLNNVVAGQFYILLVTNFAGSSQNIVITQTGGSASLNCTSVCDITGITHTLSTCSALNTYSVRGTVSVNGLPTVGSLTVTNSCGGTDMVFNAPFPNPITYSFTNLTADGSACTVLAKFSSLTTCSLTTSYTAPQSPVLSISPSSNPLCLPGSETLTASGASTYTWSTASTANPIVVTPSVSTTYSVFGTSSSGCISSAAINLTVASTPTIPAFAIPSQVCSGSPATLVATGALSFIWQPGSLAGNTVVVTPTLPTTYTVTGTLGVCSNTATTFVNVVNGPTLVTATSSSTLCPGSSVTLSATGAANYTWFPGGTVSNSIVVSPGVTTTYSVVGINFSGCTSTATILETVNPVPTIVLSPASPTLCAGSSIALSATGATSYTWNPGNLTGSSVNVSPATNTSYTVVGSNGTCTNSAITAVTVVPLPAVGSSASSATVCSGNSVTLTATGATSYNWNPGSLSGAVVVVSPVSNTTYTVTGSLNGCSSNTTVAITVINGPVVNAVASPTAICLGNTATLTASGAAAYTWTPGGLTTAVINVSPASTTLYSVTGSNAAGCLTTATVNLVVNPLPTILVSASSTSVCIGSSTTLTATGATTYTWNPGNLSGASVVVSPVSNTTYTVIAANAGGCVGQNTINIGILPLPTVGATSSPTAICNGATALLTGSGATSYTWNPGNLTGTSVNVSPVTNTTYTVTGSVSGCTNTANVTVVVNNGPAVSASALPASVCPGSSSTLTATGATSYTWNPGNLTGASVVVIPVATTVYSVTGDNGSGCTTTQTVLVTVLTSPTIIASTSSPSVCTGGSATLTASGASTYTWNPGTLSGAVVVVSPSSNTTYTVTGTNVSGCTGQANITINITPIPVVGATSTPTAICNGSTATLTGTGATSYTWNPGNLSGTTVLVSPTSNTTYTVIGDNGGCIASSTVAVVVNNGPAVSALAFPANVCPGGTSTLIASGAVSYSWSTGATTSSTVVNPIATTVYTVTGTNGSGCATIRTVTVTTNPAPTIVVSASSTSICAGSSTTLTASGASTYTWNPGNLHTANIIVSPSVSTIYTVTGFSGFGCAGQNTISIIVTPIPVLGAIISPTAICAGGSATIAGSGATNYTYNPSGTTGPSVVVSPVLTTTYSILGSTNGCNAVTIVTVVVNSSPVLSASASPSIICSGDSSTLSASGATSYTWNPGGLTAGTITVSPAATTIYTLTGSNGSGCNGTQTVQVTVTTPPAVSAAASPASICAGGSSTLSASGATSYTWNPGNLSGPTIIVSPLTSTNYTVTGSTAAGCTSQTTVDVVVTPIPTINATSLPTSICAGGSATLSATGATTYTWLPVNISGANITVFPASTTVYTVIGQTFGCAGFDTVTVNVNSNPVLTALASPASICVGGTSTLTASGALAYTWTPGGLAAQSITVSPSSTTIYTLTGSNGSGCTGTETVQVTVGTAPTIIISASSPSICAGSNATLTASGATSYTWNPGGLTGASIIVSPSSNTTYTVTGDNGAGCTADASISVFITPTPVVGAISSPTAICNGDSSVLSGFGATNYVWLPGNLSGPTVTVSPTASTTYTLFGDNSGCVASTTVNVVVNNGPAITAFASPSVICSNGSSTLTASGATSYTWLPGNLSSGTIVVTPSLSTTYTVTADAGTGCTSTTTVQVNISTSPNVFITSSSSSICNGGSATLTASGAAAYTWTPGGSNSSVLVVSPTSTTTYTLTGDNGAGCIGQDQLTINVGSAPALTVTALPSTICNGNTATLTASGAVNYTWTPGGFTAASITVSPSSNTIYTVTGDNGGCTSTGTVGVNVNSSPSLTISSTSASICSGASATLTALGTVSFTWMPGGSTNNSIIVSPTSTTIYTVTGSNGAGCSTTSTYTLNVGTSQTITVSANPPAVCQGFTTTLTASGGSTYTWAPVPSNGAVILSNPMITTTYTVYSDNGSCISSAMVTVTVNPLPIITATASPTSICSGNTVTLSASGAASYTWIPGFLQGATVTDTPSGNTTYTVVGLSPIGCPNFAVASVTVLSSPTVVLTSSSPGLCIGSTATLTASGATAYTLEPGSLTGTTFTVNPTTTTTYTLFGDNGGCASGTAVLTLNVNQTPTITASNANGVLCGGSTLTLTASGATNYTWNPGGLIGSTITDNPAISTVYTVSGTDANGCSSETTIAVSVNPSPTLVIVPSATNSCEGASVTLTASGAVTYSWNPTGLNTAVITDAPVTNTTYTVSGSDAIGCVGSQTILITVVSTPTISVTPIHATVCEGSPVTFTATGATSYTWLPSGTTASVDTETPIANTNYTVIGDNGGGCLSTFTLDIFVTPIPTGLTASASGSITCATPSVDLTGSSTSTNVSYSWTGPNSFTSAVQNPTAVTAWGVYTLSVSDNATGCVATTTLDVLTDNSIPSVTATTSGSITCSAASVTLNAANTTTNPGYAWFGPGSFSSTIQSPTAAIAGDYTVTVFDITSNCKTTAVVTVGTHTSVSITASIAPATCSTNSANNDGTISVYNFDVLDKFDLVSGSSYTGTATYSTANLIPSNGVITNNLANPTSTLAFTIRLFDAGGCIKDTTLILQPVDCVPRTLGIAKEVSTVTPNSDGSYNITYTVIVKNYDLVNPVTNIILTEDLAAAFPAPATFTLSTPLIIDSVGTGLIKNASFDGVLQTNLTNGSISSLAAGKADTIVFNLTVKTNGFFGPYANTVVGEGVNQAGTAMRDSSATGLNPDSDGDGNPNNNSLPTVITFSPQTFFGITKTGVFSNKLSDGTYDITYSVTIHNLGNDTLYGVVLADSLFEKTIRHPATFTMKSSPGSDGNLIANAAFDGKTNINLVDSLTSKMPPGAVNTITFTINANLDTITVVKNSAYGHCLTRDNKTLSDTSNAGTNPDSNHNDIWNEAADNIPTVLTIKNYTLFIPQGFSPDGDAINQFFVIPGLPTTGDNSFTVFNRWGNKVYYKANYDNTWEGYPNVSGVLGSDKLPQGTYYYILDMKGSGMKPITGFIVLQY